MGKLLLDARVRHLSDYSYMGHVLLRGRGLFTISLLRLRCIIPPFFKGPKAHAVLGRANVPAKPADAQMGQ